MPSDLRPQVHKSSIGHLHSPLLANDKFNPPRKSYDSPILPSVLTRHTTFHERDPHEPAASATRKKYTIAAFFLGVSLIAFTIQTETAVYIQHYLHWNKAYCMLYVQPNKL